MISKSNLKKLSCKFFMTSVKIKNNIGKISISYDLSFFIFI